MQDRRSALRRDRDQSVKGVLTGWGLLGWRACSGKSDSWACLRAHGRIIHDRGNGRVKLQVLVWPD